MANDAFNGTDTNVEGFQRAEVHLRFNRGGKSRVNKLCSS
jgi:hypothetical protein